jgi:hypothetical protein
MCGWSAYAGVMRRLRLRVRAFRRMPVRARRVFWPALPLGLLIKVLLKTVGVKRTLTVARTLGGRRLVQAQTDGVAVVVATEVVRGVQAAAGAAPSSVVCLPRSITAWVILRRIGVGASVRVGMDTGKTAEAHAWVTVDGEAVGENAEQLARMATFDEPLLVAG